MPKKPASKKPPIDYRKTLLAVVRGSIGSTAFRHLFLRTKKSSVDILRSGELSCAFFVSNVLHGLGLIKEVHATVDGTVKDMRNSGWTKIRKLRSGAVLVWGPVTYSDGETHPHIGFAISSTQAVSTSYRQRRVAKHAITFGPRSSTSYRPLVAVWWHPKLD